MDAEEGCAVSLVELADDLENLSEADLQRLLVFLRGLCAKIIKELRSRARRRLRLEWLFIRLKKRDC